jgi:hypothetical protein
MSWDTSEKKNLWPEGPQERAMANGGGSLSGGPLDRSICALKIQGMTAAHPLDLNILTCMGKISSQGEIGWT